MVGVKTSFLVDPLSSWSNRAIALITKSGSILLRGGKEIHRRCPIDGCPNVLENLGDIFLASDCIWGNKEGTNW